MKTFTETNQAVTEKYNAVISQYSEVDDFQPIIKRQDKGTKEWTSQEKAKMNHRKGRANKKLSWNIVASM